MLSSLVKCTVELSHSMLWLCDLLLYVHIVMESILVYAHIVMESILAYGSDSAKFNSN